jgi:SNF2 family DNA or RNA helicase
VNPLPLFPYQDDGATFLAGRERAGLFDEMGVGKTAQAIGALDKVGARRVVVVAPAAVREVWVGEFRKFARIPRKVLKGKSVDDLNLWLRGRADVLILSYEHATKWSKKLQGDLFDALIFDEAHKIKNAQAQRTIAMLGAHASGEHGLARWAAHVWFLTGTPLHNDPVDVWPFLRFTGATRLTLAPFIARYFHSRAGTYGSRQEPREEMVAELRHVIRSVSLRRTHGEVGLQLPPLWTTTLSVDGDTAELRALLREHPGLDQAVLEAVEKGGLSFLDAQHIGTLRRLVGEAKAPAAAQLIADELEQTDGKRVVMGIHRSALQTVYDELDRRGFGPVLIVGDTPERQRVAAVERFQTDPTCRVFVGNLIAAGAGLTLTAADELDILESSWAPADNAQALKRIHRVGQTRACRGRFISLAGSIDEVVDETVERKTAAILKIEGRRAA